jgi:hypothetical protein
MKSRRVVSSLWSVNAVLTIKYAAETRAPVSTAPVNKHSTLERMMQKRKIIYRHAKYVIWIECSTKKVWVTMPCGTNKRLPIQKADWPTKANQAMGAVVLKCFSEMNGLQLGVPEEDLRGPDGGRAMHFRTTRAAALPEIRMPGFYSTQSPAR